MATALAVYNPGPSPRLLDAAGHQVDPDAWGVGEPATVQADVDAGRLVARTEPVPDADLDPAAREVFLAAGILEGVEPPWTDDQIAEANADGLVAYLGDHAADAQRVLDVELARPEAKRRATVVAAATDAGAVAPTPNPDQ